MAPFAVAALASPPRRGAGRHGARQGTRLSKAPHGDSLAILQTQLESPRRCVPRERRLVKSWLRKIAGVFSFRRDPGQSTLDDWRPGDFTPAAEPVAVPDPWHGEATPAQSGDPRAHGRLQERSPASTSAATNTGDGGVGDTAPQQPAVRALTPPSKQTEPAPHVTALDEAWGADAFATVTWPQPASFGQPDSTDDADISRPQADHARLDAVPPHVELPDYDPTLNQRLGSEAWEVFDPARAQAGQKAALIVAELDVTTRRELDDAQALLEALFLEEPSPATLRELQRAALEGLDFATLRNMVELRALWAQQPQWWACRRFSRHRGTRATTPDLLPQGARTLSWALARRICLARADYPVEQMIDPDWLGEWRRLPARPGTPISFVDYLAEKLEFESAEQLDAGLDHLDRAGCLDEPYDHHGWALSIRDPADGQRLSLSMAHVLGPHVKTEAEAAGVGHAS